MTGEQGQTGKMEEKELMEENSGYIYTTSRPIDGSIVVIEKGGQGGKGRRGEVKEEQEERQILLK